MVSPLPPCLFCSRTAPARRVEVTHFVDRLLVIALLIGCFQLGVGLVTFDLRWLAAGFVIGSGAWYSRRRRRNRRAKSNLPP